MTKEIIELYTKALEIARENEQIIGEKCDYYITLWQLENLMEKIMEKEEKISRNIRSH